MAGGLKRGGARTAPSALVAAISGSWRAAGFRGRLASWALHALLVVAAAIVLFPFLWIAAAAFKTHLSLITGELFFRPTWANFDEILFSTTSDYIANFFNSLVVATGSTALALFVATLAAYAICRARWPAWAVNLFLLWSTVFYMIPAITFVGAWYVMFRSVGLYDTHLGLILAHATLNLPIAIWLMANFIREVPQELDDAARIDGCGPFAVLWRVIVPVIMPGIAATIIVVFIQSWNEFVVSLNLTARETATVPVAIAKYAEENETRYGEMAAGAVVSTLPAFLLLLVAQRQIVRGLTAGAVK